MRGVITKILKWLILLFSIFMFCYQTQVAVQNLLDPPVIESSKTYNIADIEPPLITICPFDQWDNMNEYGYVGCREFLLGEYSQKQNLRSWGGHRNLTFKELIGDMLPSSQELIIEGGSFENSGKKVDYEKKFYPKYGWCYEIANYTITRDFTLTLRRVNDSDFKAEVFLTDKKLRTLSTVYSDSHHGSSIIVSSDRLHTHVVNVEMLSNIDPNNPGDCKEYTYDEFELCVDKILQNIWKPIVNCNPPWLSLHNQCTGILNISSKMVSELYHQPDFDSFRKFLRMETSFVIYKCKRPCTVTRSKIFEKGNVLLEERKKKSRLQLKIAREVVYKTKIIGYGFSNFLIDMGSSMGFWFGLSVFGLTDLGITTIEWISGLKEKAKNIFW